MLAHKQRLPLLISIIITSTLLALGYWLMYRRPCQGMTPYNRDRDRSFLLQLFRDNWYWLVQEQSTFSAEHFLDAKTPGTGKNADDTKIMVYCVDGKPIGFVAYHKETFYKGRLRFIAIDTPFRGKGYSDKLMNYALEDMKKMGLGLVTLLTRTDNIPAKKLYEKYNFTDVWHDDKFVRFEKTLDTATASDKVKNQNQSIPVTQTA